METANVSAIPAPPPAAARLHASRTRVQNQRRTTWPVTGFCDRRAHETAARLRPRLHHRPATAPAGSTTSSEPAGPGCSPRPPAAPAPTVRCTARALERQPAPPPWPRRPPVPRPRRSSSPWADLPDDRLLRKVQAAGESAGSSLVGRNRLRRHFGAARLRRPAAGRTPAWSRSPSSPKCCACVVIERCAATAQATSDAELAAARGCETR
jgi:hypothetical protein